MPCPHHSTAPYLRRIVRMSGLVAVDAALCHRRRRRRRCRCRCCLPSSSSSAPSSLLSSSSILMFTNSFIFPMCVCVCARVCVSFSLRFDRLLLHCRFVSFSFLVAFFPENEKKRFFLLFATIVKPACALVCARALLILSLPSQQCGSSYSMCDHRLIFISM